MVPGAPHEAVALTGIRTETLSAFGLVPNASGRYALRDPRSFNAYGHGQFEVKSAGWSLPRVSEEGVRDGRDSL
jgi:hypothetical protein